MNPQAPQIARGLFLKAIEDGPIDVPTAVQKMLHDLPSDAAQSSPLKTVALTETVAEQFSTWKAFWSAHTMEAEQAERCVNALRWVLRELEAWTPEVPLASLRLRTLLAALAAFDVAYAGVDSVLQRFTTPPFVEGLRCLLARVVTEDMGRDAEDTSLRMEVQAAGRAGSYEWLGNVARRLEPRLQPDTWLAIHLLWRMQPALLAGVISQKQDAIFSHAVCYALADSAPEFALGVGDITFKFFSVAAVASLPPERAPSEAVRMFGELLRQVARSPYWRSWLRAYCRCSSGNTVSGVALSKSLGQLEPRHWEDFVSALELWTLTGAAESVAEILIPFHQEVGDQRAREMWLLAFRRWNQWDYGREEKNRDMFAPAACSFDFPVAMHYAHLPHEEVMAEETRLMDEIASVEQQWFSSESDLITSRNRLLSRLRLVRHGQALASGATDPLPPPIQPDGEYAALRYRYWDVHAPRRQ